MQAVKDRFIEVLQETFVQRCRRNPSYSLRAYARSLGIEASPLSALIRGKRPLTEKMKRRLAKALNLGPTELQKLNGAGENVDFQQIALDTYAIISDWYHYAILELTKIDGFVADIRYIARKLGISRTEAQIAVERLQRTGLLKISGNGKWQDTTTAGFATNIISDNLTSAASKKLQRQVLELSMRALDDVSVEARNHTSMTMAANPEDLPTAAAKIKKFRRDLCLFLERNKKPTQVFNLAISLYPVTKGEN